MSNPSQPVQKLSSYCNILRDDGLSYGSDRLELEILDTYQRLAERPALSHFSRGS